MMLALLSRYALAATLQVAPVTLDLQSNQRAAAVYLTNSGKAAIHAQIRVYEWTQKNGKDVLVATGEVVSSPAMTSGLRRPPGSNCACPRLASNSICFSGDSWLRTLSTMAV